MTATRRASKPATSAPAPVVAAPVFVQAMARSGRRCECTRKGCHGTTGRCAREHPGHRLIVAPSDVTVPARLAWRVPAEYLAVWCSRCHAIALSDGRRARAEADRVAAEPLLLVLAVGE